MEESLMRVIIISSTRMKELAINANSLIDRFKETEEPTNELLRETEVTSAKLDNTIKKLQTDLLNYFRLANEPAADEISEISTFQLQAEETLIELKARMKQEKKEANVSARLPKLVLPEFKGNVLEWHQFWDQFSSNIGSRNIADVDKLLYLKSALRGEAQESVEGLEMTNKNYYIAVSTLRERYGRIGTVIDAHYSALNKITPATTETSDCRRVINDIERHLRVLASLGEDTSHSHLRFLIMEKFPEELIYEMKMKIKTESIEEIRKEIQRIISAREDVKRLTQGKDNKVEGYTTSTLHVMEETRKGNFDKNIQRFRPSGGRNFKRRYEETTSTTRPDQNGSDWKRPKLLCVFCKESHFNDQCNNYKTSYERKAQLGKRCFNCLGFGHGVMRCPRKIKCYHCQGTHNRAVCPKKFSVAVTGNDVLSPSDNTKTICNTNNITGSLYLQTATVTLHNDKTKKPCRVLLDSGSQRCYITNRMAQRLNLNSNSEDLLMIYTFGSETPRKTTSPSAEIDLETKRGIRKSLRVNIVHHITDRIPIQPKSSTPVDIMADDDTVGESIDLLIGNDYYFSFMRNESIQIQENLYIVNTDFGWIMTGKESTSGEEATLSLITYCQYNPSCSYLTEPDLPLRDIDIKFLWTLESIGITDSPKTSREEEAVKHFNDTAVYHEGRYYVKWPWTQYPPELPTNYGLAYGRLKGLCKRLDQTTLQDYAAILKEQLDAEIIEVIKPESVTHYQHTSHPIHYLPHHIIQQKGKRGRIVYDASAKVKEQRSLNESLYCGPTMLEDITGLLVKFRCHPIGICADVEKAFLQIGLQAEDRDVTRFLWLNDIHKPISEDNLLHLRFCRMPFGIISSPFLLNATIRCHLKKSDKVHIKQLSNDIYVDNLVTGVKTSYEATELYQQSKEVFHELSMNLRDWSSNSEELMKQIPDICKDKVVKVLGLNWNINEDTLQLRFSNTVVTPKTKREILRIVASVYDPCGVAVPQLLSAKLMLQDLWKTNTKWDTKLPQSIIDKWEEIRNDLKDIQEICIPRRYFQGTKDEYCHLHCFTDASTKAFSAVIFIVIGNEASFVIGKSRLVPIKDQESLSIPRLELLGVMIGCRLIKYVLPFLQFQVKQQILWTDSQIVIEWCRSNKLLPPFVARRVEEIKANKELIMRYVPTELNPADVATRPSITREERKRWLTGPAFILENAQYWPSITTLFTGEGLPKEDQSDKCQKNVVHVSQISEEQPREEQRVESGRPEENEIPRTIEEIKRIQAEHYSQELEGKETSLKRNLGLFIDVDGILRCRGRLMNTNWDYDKRYPILLPKDCEYTNKVIMKTHNENYHVGANHTLSIIRQSFWIPQGKSQVQKVLKRCPRCIKHGGGPFKLPSTPALPPERVNYSAPFTFTGIDYLGPVLVKTDAGKGKRWICLFTCLAVRAIHLELVQDLTAEEGLLALRRMMSTRGVPSIITSDNATNFKLLSEILNQPLCIDRRIQWRFIPQLAPWFGGFYERLIGIVKNCMMRTLEKHLLTDSQMNTVIKEIEAVVNTRPLTCVDTEMSHILKPADFLAMRETLVVSTAEDKPLPHGTQTKIDLIDSWRRGLTILSEFKEMFKNRYLLSLRERYSHSHKQPRTTSKLVPTEGQIVQIKGDNKNREEWRVGKILSLQRGADQLCRVAKVKVGDKEFIRSIAHLYPLEIEDDEQDGANEESHIILPVEPSNSQGLHIPEIEVDSLPSNDVSEVLQQDGTHVAETIDDGSLLGEHTEPRYSDMEVVVAPNEPQDEELNNPRQRRDAAVRALEKIRQWTRSLLSLL